MYFYLKKIFQKWFQPEVYLDHASTTPLDAEVFFTMRSVFKNIYGNRGGWYPLGIHTAQCINQSREIVAQTISAQSSQIIFTRGGTEANNLAILGAVAQFKKNYPTVMPHIITSSIEHDSVLETCKHLEHTNQVTVSYIPCNTDGIVEVADIKKQLRPETILISIMYANNEIGTIQPIKEIAKLVRWWKKQTINTVPFSPSDSSPKRGSHTYHYPLFHTDAIQAVNYCDINVLRLGIDMMSISGSKIYGPKSSGALFIKNRDFIGPILYGGGQEFGLRSGTEDVAMIAGFAKAFEISQEIKESEVARLTTLRDFVINELLQDDRIMLNGTRDNRLPNNINITIAGFSAEWVVLQLAARGFAVSSKSACQSDSDEESHVIASLRSAQGMSSKSEEGSVRITLGRGTTKRQVERFLKNFQEIIT